MTGQPLTEQGDVVFEPKRFSDAGEQARVDRQACHERHDRECDGCAWCRGSRTDYHRWFTGSGS